MKLTGILPVRRNSAQKRRTKLIKHEYKMAFPLGKQSMINTESIAHHLKKKCHKL